LRLLLLLLLMMMMMMMMLTLYWSLNHCFGGEYQLTAESIYHLMYDTIIITSCQWCLQYDFMIVYDQFDK